MSEREDFLARWSHRKRQAADEVEVAPEQQQVAPAQTANDDESLDKEKIPQSKGPLFDPATLPSVESISAETDIRAFLAPGVPAEITRAALRRAWATDPTIRDFVGLADYAWDFHAPGAMAGFGPLEMTDELRREIVGMLTRGQSRDNAVGDSSSAASKKMPQSPQQFGLTSELGENESQEATDVNQPGELQVCSEVRLQGKGNVAAQYPAPEQQQSQGKVQRRHGRALPKS
jgi:hypothetical protein